MTVTFGQQGGAPRRRNSVAATEPAPVRDVVALLARRRQAGEDRRHHQSHDLDETREDAG